MRYFLILVVFLFASISSVASFAKELSREERRAELLRKIETSRYESQIEKYGEVRTLYLDSDVKHPEYKIYYASVTDKISSVANARYPRAIRRIGRSMIVGFAIELDQDGALVRIKSVSKSGSRITDLFVLSLLKKSQPYPNFGEKFESNIRSVVLIGAMWFNPQDELTKDSLDVRVVSF